MKEKDYEKLFDTKELQFNSFLNKTIILNAKDYYRKSKTKEERELNILEEENFENEFSKFIEEPETLLFKDDADNFMNFIDNIDLYLALKSLSDIEQMVIFLMFKEQLSQKEIAKILNVYHKTVSKINKRALEKLKKFLKGDL